MVLSCSGFYDNVMRISVHFRASISLTLALAGQVMQTTNWYCFSNFSQKMGIDGSWRLSLLGPFTWNIKPYFYKNKKIISKVVFLPSMLSVTVCVCFTWFFHCVVLLYMLVVNRKVWRRVHSVYLLTLKALSKIEADDILPARQFTWNVKPYFLWKKYLGKIKNIVCCSCG